MDRRQQTTAPTVPMCCGRPMSAVSVTEEGTELRLLSCSSCSRHAWLQDGVLLDRAEMLDAVKRRLQEAPRPKPGRPKGSRTQRPSGQPAATARATPARPAARPAPRPDEPAGPAAGTGRPTDEGDRTAAPRADLPEVLRGFRVLGGGELGVPGSSDRSD